jgi:transposase
MGVSKFPPGFHDHAVGLVVQSDRPIARVAEELGIGAETLRRWVRQTEVDQGQGRVDQ